MSFKLVERWTRPSHRQRALTPSKEGLLPSSISLADFHRGGGRQKVAPPSNDRYRKQLPGKTSGLSTLSRFHLSLRDFDMTIWV